MVVKQRCSCRLLSFYSTGVVWMSVINELLLYSCVDKTSLTVQAAPLLNLFNELGAETFQFCDAVYVLLSLKLHRMNTFINSRCTSASAFWSRGVASATLLRTISAGMMIWGAATITAADLWLNCFHTAWASLVRVWRPTGFVCTCFMPLPSWLLLHGEVFSIVIVMVSLFLGGVGAANVVILAFFAAAWVILCM